MPHSIVLYEQGEPNVMKWEEININNPSKGEVLIKQRKVGLNYIDTYHRSGLYPLPTPLPVCPGLEASGEIIEIGENINNFSISCK